MAYEGRLTRGQGGWRIRALRFSFLAGVCLIVMRLFVLQVAEASWYRALSAGQHAIYEELIPTRGSMYVKDAGDDTEYAVATNEPRAFVYADPRLVTEPINTARAIAKILQLEGWDTYGMPVSKAPSDSPIAGEELSDTPPVMEGTGEAGPTDTEILVERLQKVDDPYEPVARDVSQEDLDAILALELPGVAYILEDDRAYPEGGFGGHALGFLGHNEEGGRAGYYGLEGYFNDFLAGITGSLYSETDASGRWVGVGARSFTPAVDGGDLLLTIDRTVQYMACAMLRDGVQRFDADGGALVIVEPATGRVLAMCSAPDFDPNDYGNVDDVSVYNNTVIFEPYEPGSIFKPLTMAAAIEVGAVTPNTTFEDTGAVEVDDYTIKNSDLKAHGLVTMTEVLDESLNTGMVWIMRKMGRDVLKDFIAQFGFGSLSGITLSTESTGTIDALNESAEVYAATASFGQGITVTPLQIAMGYAAIANGGALMQPYIVEEMRYPDGTVERTAPKKIRQVLEKKTATTVGAMLVSVVENGHGKRAGVPGYYIAGKTGTAQVAGRGGYLEGVTNGSFAGFGPVGDPKFAMIVKLENPKAVEWAESSAAPIFGQIADFLLEYYNIAPERPQ